MREFTPTALLFGVLIGVLFGAANAFIGLKVGMTVSASIPAAVVSMAILRGILKRDSILENNMVQTIGSAGESLAAGMIFTIPALFIFAYTDHDPSMEPSFWEMTVWGALGGTLGVLFMIPLRRMLIVKEHGKLPFPEGTACAEVLEAGQTGGVSAKTVFWGLGVGAIYEFWRGLGFWAETAKQRLPLVKSEFQLAAEPALLGVGYILGVRIAGYMLAGAVLGWFVIIPAIAFFGADAAVPLFPEKASLISQMSPDDMWNRYLRYIGAGAVVLGGLLSLVKSLGTIGRSLFHMVGGKSSGERTDRDIPTVVLLLFVAGLAFLMWYLPEVTYLETAEDGTVQTKTLLNALFKNITVIACVIAFGFFFTTVSARLVGIVGGSSNPASGMTIATLLGTALIIVYSLDLEPAVAKVAIISVGALVCMCICMAGDTSQDLKTGYLVKATPWKQQIGQIVGVLTATAALAWVIGTIDDRYGFFKDAAHPNAVLAPQANLMKLLVQGVVDQELPWVLILVGAASALIVELLGLPSLPFAVGLYLPLSLSTPIMAGGLLRWLVGKARKSQSETHSPGVLAASGLVAGHGLMGVTFVGIAAFAGWWWGDPRFATPKYHEAAQTWVSFDSEKDAWAYVDENRNTSVYFDENAKQWTDGEPPAPPPTSAPSTESTSAPAAEKGDLVVPTHFYPWLTTKVGFLDPEYGLRSRRYELGRFSGDYAVDWYHLLPLVPFSMMTIWLAVVSLRRRPEDESNTAEPVTPAPRASGRRPLEELIGPALKDPSKPRGSSPVTPPPTSAMKADEIGLEEVEAPSGTAPDLSPKAGRIFASPPETPTIGDLPELDSSAEDSDGGDNDKGASPKE